MNGIEKLNSLSADIGTWAVSHLVGTAAVLLLAAVIWLVIRKRTSAALGCWLFLLVLVKPLIPFEIGVPQDWVPFKGDEIVVTAAPVLESSAIPVTVLTATAPSVAIASEVVALEAPKLSLQSFAMIAWAAVVVSLLGRFAFLQWRTGRWLSSCSRLGEMEDEIAALAEEIGLRRCVRVFSSGKLDTPMVCGLLRPSLLLPEGFSEHLEADQRRWVLLHELAHLKRGDLWVLAFQRLAQIAFFFNPSVWIANRAVNRLREYACDDVALVHSKMDRRSCGEGFLRVVERAHSQPIPGAAALALFERHSDSKLRLARILDSRRQLAAGVGVGGIAFLVTLGLVVLPGLRAQEAAEEVDFVEQPVEMVPDGNYLVNVWRRDGQKELLNYEVKDGFAESVNASSRDSVGLKGKFIKVKPGVFKLSIENGTHRGTSFWRLKPDGSADVTEIPGSGGPQRAVPVEGEELVYPGEGRQNLIRTKFVEVDQSPQGPHRLATPVAGIVAEVLVKPGATVERGDVLVRLGARQAEAALRVAMTKLELAIEQSKLAEQTLEDAQAELQEIEKKYEQGEVDKFRVAMSQARVTELQKLAAPRALAAAELDQARIAVEQYQIVAPVGGTIESVEAKLGEYVSPEKPVILLQR